MILPYGWDLHVSCWFSTVTYCWFLIKLYNLISIKVKNWKYNMEYDLSAGFIHVFRKYQNQNLTLYG